MWRLEPERMSDELSVWRLWGKMIDQSWSRLLAWATDDMDSFRSGFSGGFIYFGGDEGAEINCKV